MRYLVAALFILAGLIKITPVIGDLLLVAAFRPALHPVAASIGLISALVLSRRIAPLPGGRPR